MALKALLLRQQINTVVSAIAALRAKDDEFTTREAELTQAIEEMTAETTEEERSAVQSTVDAFEAELQEHRDAIAAQEARLAELKSQLDAEEARQTTTPPAAPEQRAAEHEERRENITMNTRTRIFARMNMQERQALLDRQDVRDFLGNVRDHIKHKRSITNVGETIPEVIVGFIREIIAENSVLYKHVNVIHVSGEARQVVMGSIPEAVWTDCCAQLNELNLAFYGQAFDCFKVGGFFALCKANIEDSDLNLLAEVAYACGKAIAKALDKAGFYGTGNGMPLGIVTRLAQTSQPANYPPTARPWVDLHTSNIQSINGSSLEGVAFFQALAGKVGLAKHKYTNGSLTWYMNETTWMTIVAKAMAINAAGNLVSAVGRVMPVLGGAIETMDDMADNDIVFGYFDLYTLAERAGITIASSDEVRFLQDQTVVKGTARYDGAPVIAEAFVALNIANSTPATTATFAADGANTVAGILLPATASVASGSTIALPAVLLPLGVEDAITWASATTGKATVDSDGVVTGVATGSSVITATANGKSASCTVTVTSA